MSQMMRTTNTLVPQAKLGTLAQLASSPVLILDRSGSMADRLRDSDMRKIDRLREVVAGLNQQGVAFRQVVFDHEILETTVIGEPRGGTNLTGALMYALETAHATKIAVVSDGIPDNKETAMEAAQRAKELGVKIDTFYCGNPGTEGEAFLHELARMTGGQGQTVDLSDEPAALTGKTMLALTDGGTTQGHGPIAL